MEHVGIDVHASESQICLLTEQGEILEHRVRTRPDRFEEILGNRTRARILIEASTESEWVARCLESLGHEVIVADPNYAPMYATRSRRVKTDRRDAQALMDACRLGAYRPAHRTSDPQRQVRAELAVRDALVRTRARFISLIRALLRRDPARAAARGDRAAARDDGDTQPRNRCRRRAVGPARRGRSGGAAARDRAQHRTGHRSELRRHA